MIWRAFIFPALLTFVAILPQDKHTGSHGSERALLLAEKPPAYKPGEVYTGKVTDLTGQTMTLRQATTPTPVDGVVYLYVAFIDGGGKILLDLAVDPSRYLWMTAALSPAATSTTTCSPKGLYPITFGKVYTCSSYFSERSDVQKVEDRFTFGKVLQGSGGTQEFCALHEVEGYRDLTRWHICFTADGKWVTQIIGLEHRVLERA